MTLYEFSFVAFWHGLKLLFWATLVGTMLANVGGWVTDAFFPLVVGFWLVGVFITALGLVLLPVVLVAWAVRR